MKFSKKIVLIILMIINVFSFYKLNVNDFDITKVFKPTCLITNMEDIDKCYKSNRNVVIKTSNIYETGYNYLDKNYVFADIDISGKTLIGLINKKDLSNKRIYGYLNFTTNIVFTEVIKNIKQDYKIKMNIDNIDEVFIPIELNSYHYINSNIVNNLMLILFLITLFGIIYVSIKMIKEEKYEK